MSNRDYLRSVILCEDLRVEVTGREIAIGIIPGSLQLDQIPFILSNFVVRLELDFAGQPVSHLELRIDNPVNSVMFSQTMPIKFRDWGLPGSAAVALSGFIIPLEGDYPFWVRTNIHVEWLLGTTLKIRKTDADIIQERQRQIREALHSQEHAT